MWESFFSSWLIRWACRVLRSSALARSVCSAGWLARVPSDGVHITRSLGQDRGV